MDIEKLNLIKKAFLAEYGNFADKRIRKIEKGSTFIIDDRDTEPSFGSNGPFGWFCQIFAELKSHEEILLTIRGPLPMNGDVKNWIRNSGMTVNRDIYSITITPENADKLRDLATALRAIVARGATYDTSSHKYVCPRIASCLMRLHQVLDDHWVLI